MNTTPPGCALPGITNTNNSSKKRKSPDDFHTSIQNVMHGTLKSLANASILVQLGFVRTIKLRNALVATYCCWRLKL